MGLGAMDALTFSNRDSHASRHVEKALSLETSSHLFSIPHILKTTTSTNSYKTILSTITMATQTTPSKQVCCQSTRKSSKLTVEGVLEARIVQNGCFTNETTNLHI